MTFVGDQQTLCWKGGYKCYNEHSTLKLMHGWPAVAPLVFLFAFVAF